MPLMILARQQMFALNLYFIVGAVIVLTLLLLIVIGVWTAAKAGIWQLRRRRAAQGQYRRLHRLDGEPHPPAARGLCDCCQQVHAKVYHLPSGQRRCPACYEQLLKEQP